MKIEVFGDINVGKQMKLAKHEAPRENGNLRLIPSRDPSQVGPGKRRRGHRALSDPIIMRPITYEFEKLGIDFSIEGDGLALQYAIFGGPGSGKTNTLMHLLSQIVSKCFCKDPCTFNRKTCNNLDRKFGGLILDPKAALIDDVKAIFSACDRQDDLIIINRNELKENGVNVLDCCLDPSDLGNAMVTAVQSTGVDASEPYWFQQIGMIFGAIIWLLKFTKDVPTINGVMQQALLTRIGNKLYLERLIKDAQESYEEYKEEKGVRDLPYNDPVKIAYRDAQQVVDDYLKSQEKDKIILTQFMRQAFGAFGKFENLCYSDGSNRLNIYDQIIEEGKFILVSTGPQELMISRILPTLVKFIYQRTVLSRFDRYPEELHNAERPLLLMADEYHVVATEIEGNPFGDSEFFSQSRQFGALSIMATQSVKQLEKSLGDAWEAISGTLSAIMFMSQRDPYTAEFAQKYSGEHENLVHRMGVNINNDGRSTSDSPEIIKELRIPPGIIEHKLTVGQVVVVGKTKGHSQPSTTSYVQVPEFIPPNKES